jgi:ectoine hydroxylase-related dioxygenase (phytanoyl-CoA dioxygenase family)
VLLRIGVFDKLPGGAGIEVHQHATLVDESKYRSLTIWLPASDTSVAMGTLHVVKGSHEFTDGFRSKNRRLDDFRRVSRRVLERHSTPIVVHAGQAIVFDDRLIHWSPPNRSSLVRTALQLMLVPDEAELVTYYRTDGHELAKYAVDRKTYREHWMTQVNPESLTSLGKVSQAEITYGDKEFLSMVRRTGSAVARAPEPFLSRVFNGIRARLGS